MNKVLSTIGEELLQSNYAFCNDEKITPGNRYSYTNPYHAIRINGQWHIFNVFPIEKERKPLSLTYS